MLTLCFAIAVILNGAVALLSASRGLQKVSIMLLASFAVSELLSNVTDPPLRMALYAMADLTGLILMLSIITKHPRARILLWPFSGLYMGMLCLHVAVLANDTPSLYAYYVGLNILFGMQLMVSTGAGIGTVIENVKSGHSVSLLDRRLSHRHR
jgi:hypothetical protein